MKRHELVMVKAKEVRANITSFDAVLRCDAEYGSRFRIHVGDGRKLDIFVEPDYKDEPKVFVSWNGKWRLFGK